MLPWGEWPDHLLPSKKILLCPLLTPFPAVEGECAFGSAETHEERVLSVGKMIPGACGGQFLQKVWLFLAVTGWISLFGIF